MMRLAVGAVEVAVVDERNVQRAAFVDAAETLTQVVDEHRATLVDDVPVLFGTAVDVHLNADNGAR